MTTWDEEKTPTIPHSIPYRAPVVMPGLTTQATATGSRPPTHRGRTPQGLGPPAPQGSTLAPLGANTRSPGAELQGLAPVSSKQGPPPLPPRKVTAEGLPSLQRLMRTWDRLTPENKRLVDSVALALLPPAEDSARR